MKNIYKKYIAIFIEDLSEKELKVIYELAQKYWARGASHE